MERKKINKQEGKKGLAENGLNSLPHRPTTYGLYNVAALTVFKKLVRERFLRCGSEIFPVLTSASSLGRKGDYSVFFMSLFPRSWYKGGSLNFLWKGHRLLAKALSYVSVGAEMFNEEYELRCSSPPAVTLVFMSVLFYAHGTEEG